MFVQICQPNASLPHPMCPLDSSLPTFHVMHQHLQIPQQHTNVSNGAVSQCQVDPLDSSLCHTLGMQLPPLDGFGETLSQVI